MMKGTQAVAQPDSDTGALVEVAPPTAYVADAADRIDKIENRMTKIDDFMKESLQYTTFRGKDLRNRLAVIEDLVRNQRDMIMRDAGDIWDQGPPKLAGGSKSR